MILITRPKALALKLEIELEKKNFLTQKEPLMSFEYLDQPIKFHSSAIYIIASLQAVQSFIDYKKTYQTIIDQGRYLVIGHEVAKQLKLLGVKNILFVSRDSEELIKFIQSKNFMDISFHYLCGSTYNKNFVTQLKEMGVKFDKKIIYKLNSRKSMSQKTIKYIKEKKIKTVLFFSRNTAAIFFQLMKVHKLNYSLINQYICISDKVAEELILNGISIEQIKVSNTPDQESMIQQLG